MNKRLISTIVIFLVLISLPYWVYIPALVLAIIFFPFYWEGIFLAFLIDILYGDIPHPTISLIFPFAFYISLFVLLLIPLRERIRLND